MNQKSQNIKQQQKILTEINKNVVETPLKQIKNKIVVDEAIIKKEVEQQLKIKDEPKNKILTDEQQRIKHETKKILKRIL